MGANIFYRSWELMNRINDNDPRWKNSFWLGLIFSNYILFIAHKFDVLQYVNVKYAGILLGAVLILSLYVAVFTKSNLAKFQTYALDEKRSIKLLGRFSILGFWIVGFVVLFYL